MPWRLETRGNETCVVKESDGSTVGCHPSHAEAEKHLAALYANEPQTAAPRVDPSTWPLYPPESWFDLPAEVPDDVYCNVTLDGPEAGRVYGLVHHAGTNLLGAPGGPWSPPPSPTALHDAQLGITETAEGTTVRTANVGGRVNHAPLTASYREAVKHYENIASQTMRIRYHQIQTASGPAIAYAGALWPDLTEIDVAHVRASGLSGDWRWRPEYNGYDFCGSQLVTNPGLPLRRVASVGELGDHPPIVVCEDGTCSFPAAASDPVDERLDEIENAVLEFADLLGYEVDPAPHTAAICAPFDRLDDIECALEELVVTAARTAGGEYIKGEGGLFAGSLPGAKGNRDVQKLLNETGLVHPPGNNVFTKEPFQPYQEASNAKREACEALNEHMVLAPEVLAADAVETFSPGRVNDALLGATGSMNSGSSYTVQVLDPNVTVEQFGELTDLEHQMYADEYKTAREDMAAELEQRAGESSTDEWGGRVELSAEEYLDIARSHGFDLDAERGIASRYVNQWATSSGDSSPLSVAIQTVAGEKYDLDSSSVEEFLNFNGGDTEAARDYNHILSGPEKGIISEYLDASYTATQERLASVTNPDGTVLLYRGVHYEHPQDLADHVSTNPLSSWSLKAQTADDFAGGGTYGYRLHTNVPVSSIFATPATGAGCLNENELIVIGGDLIPVEMAPTTPDAELQAAKALAAAAGDPLYIDDDANADWPKRTPDTFAALERSDAKTAGSSDVDYIKGEDGKFQGSRPGSRATATEKDPVKELADRAQQVDEIVTPRLKSIADEMGAELKGLDFRLKAPESLERKIGDKMAEGMTREEAAASVKDSLRYTMAVDPERYVSAAQETLDRLRTNGFRVLEEKNYWHTDETGRHDTYNGVNTVLQHEETGHLIELQFHTPESYDVKEFESHKLYEEYRLSSTSLERRQEIYDTMASRWGTVQVPPEVEKIGTPVYEQRPAA